MGSDERRVSSFLERRSLRVTLASLIVIEAIVVCVSRRPWTNPDSHIYVALADSLAHFHYGWPRLTGGYEPEAGFAIGYPLFLALVRDELHFAWSAVIGLQLAICLASLAYFARTLKERGLSDTLFLLVVAAYPFPFAYAASIAKEAPAMSAATLAVSLLLQPASRPWRIVGAGLAAGLAGLINPPLVLVLPFLLVVLIVELRGAGCDPPTTTRRCSLFVAGATLSLLPMIAYNAATFGTLKPVPNAGPTGPSLYAASWLMTDTPVEVLSHGTRAELPRELVQEVDSMQRELDAPFAWPTNAHNFPTAWQQAEYNRVYQRHALRRIRAHLGLYTRYVITQPWRLWNSGLGLRATGAPAFIVGALAVVQGLVWGLAVFGLGVALSRWRKWLGLTVYPIVITGLHSFLHAEARYTAAVRWFAAALAALALQTLLGRIERRTGEAAPLASSASSL